MPHTKCILNVVSTFLIQVQNVLRAFTRVALPYPDGAAVTSPLVSRHIDAVCFRTSSIGSPDQDSAEQITQGTAW